MTNKYDTKGEEEVYDVLPLTFHPASTKYESKRYPHGYWYVYSIGTDCEGEGPDPLTAMTALAIAMEKKTLTKEASGDE